MAYRRASLIDLYLVPVPTRQISFESDTLFVDGLLEGQTSLGGVDLITQNNEITNITY